MEDLEQFSVGDLLVLANAAASSVSREESLSVEVAKHTCEQLEACDFDCGLMQQRGKAAPMKVVEEANPNRCGGCREDRLFKKKYVRRKRVNNLVAGTSNVVHKSSWLINVDDPQREEVLYNNGGAHSKSEQVVEGQGRCGGIKEDKSNRDENHQEIIPKRRSLILDILGIKNQEVPKRKRSQRKAKPEEPKKDSGERRQGKGRACDRMDCDAGDEETENEEDDDDYKPEEDEEEEEEEDTISETDLNQAALGSYIAHEEMFVSESEDFLPLLEESDETEEEEEDASYVSDATSFKTQPPNCEGIRYVQWSNKKKRNCMKTQSNRKILLLAVEAITHQLGLLGINIEEKSS